MHKGVDFPLPIGTPIIATADGEVDKVVSSRGKSSFGRYILLCHDEVYSSLYAHLSKTLVKEGQEVLQGDTIGFSGNSGLTTSPHLHYEIFKYGRQVNPIKFLPKKSKKRK